MRLSDEAVKGAGGLVAQTTALAVGGAMMAGLFFGQLGLVLKASGTLAGAWATSLMLRAPGVLRLMTSPRLRKAEYEKAIKAGAKLASTKTLRQQGPWIYTLNQLADMVPQQLTKLAGSGIIGEAATEEVKRIPETSPYTLPDIPYTDEPLIKEEVGPAPQIQRVQPLSAREPSPDAQMTASDVERQRVQNQLAGLPA